MVQALLKDRGELVVRACSPIHDRHGFQGCYQVTEERNTRKKKTDDAEDEDIDIDKVW
jgi:hypothetical protein